MLIRADVFEQMQSLLGGFDIEAYLRHAQQQAEVVRRENETRFNTHANTKGRLEEICGNTDLPTAGLVRDLKQRGLLEETIVIWSGEFGRLPVSQNGTGRDHNRNGFSLLVAGGGFKAGHVHGETDDVGYAAATARVSVADLHALPY